MDALEKYVHDFSEPEEELLHELDRETNLRAVAPRMISGHIQGRLLEMLVRMLRPRRALEIGTFTGYSALSMAAGLGEGATLDTIEVDDELEELAQRFFDRSPCGGKTCSSAWGRLGGTARAPSEGGEPWSAADEDAAAAAAAAVAAAAAAAAVAPRPSTGPWECTPLYETVTVCVSSSSSANLRAGQPSCVQRK